jgi:hypothetical protein
MRTESKSVLKTGKRKRKISITEMGREVNRHA